MTADPLAADLGPEVGALPDAGRDLASTLELPRLLDLLLEHLGRLLPYRGTAILVLEGEQLCFAGMRGPESFSWEEARTIRYPLAEFGPVWDRLSAEEPIVVPDVRGPSLEARTFRRMVGEEALDGPLSSITSLMWVPLVVRGQIIGLLSITSPTVDAYGSGLTAEFLGEDVARLCPEVERELYRVAQEALNNLPKHAHANRVTVLLDVDAGRVALEVDDGVGFDAALRGVGGFGLPGMRERVERLAGKLAIESAPGAGTRVRAEVPR